MAPASIIVDDVETPAPVVTSPTRENDKIETVVKSPEIVAEVPSPTIKQEQPV